MNLKCMGCKKDAITIYDGNAACLNHYAYLLAEKQYYNIMYERSKRMKQKKNITVEDSLDFPDKEDLEKKYYVYLKKMYGGKRGTKSSN